MIKSFDDALNNHKKVLTESLVNFHEGHRVRKILLDVDSNSADYEYYSQSGQQSKQDEIDELKLKLSEDSRVLHNVIDIERIKCEELQKLIDDALKWCEKGCVLKAMEVLKGEETK